MRKLLQLIIWFMIGMIIANLSYRVYLTMKYVKLAMDPMIYIVVH